MSAYLSGWVGGFTAYLGVATAYLVALTVMIIGLVSVQTKLKLGLPNGTELGKIAGSWY